MRKLKPMEVPENRVIHLTLRKSYLENYLRYIFKSPKGAIKVTRCEDIGQQLYSRVRYSDLPKRNASDKSISLLMPDHPLDQSQYRYIYFTEDDTARINDYIESMAKLDLRLMVHVGVNELNINRKSIITVLSIDLFGSDKFEMLKKDDYRRREKIRDYLPKFIQSIGI
jgi:hypothetical protein